MKNVCIAKMSQSDKFYLRIFKRLRVFLLRLSGGNGSPSQISLGEHCLYLCLRKAKSIVRVKAESKPELESLFSQDHQKICISLNGA